MVCLVRTWTCQLVPDCAAKHDEIDACMLLPFMAFDTVVCCAGLKSPRRWLFLVTPSLFVLGCVEPPRRNCCTCSLLLSPGAGMQSGQLSHGWAAHCSTTRLPGCSANSTLPECCVALTSAYASFMLPLLGISGADVHSPAEPGSHLWHQGRSSRRRIQPGMPVAETRQMYWHTKSVRKGACGCVKYACSVLQLK